MPEQTGPTTGALTIVISPNTGCTEASAGLIKESIAEAVARAIRALGLPPSGTLSVQVGIGPVEQGPYSVTAGDMIYYAQPAAVAAGASLTTVVETVAATILTERSILCAVTGLTDPGPQRLVQIGAAVPQAPLPSVSLERACEELLAARTGPVLAVSLAADLAATAAEDLPGALEAARRELFTYWGIPLPIISVETDADLRPGQLRPVLLDTPFVFTMPSAGTDGIRDTVRNIAASNLTSLITAKGVDVLLAVYARTDPRLVGALRDRYETVDLTGVLRTMLSYQLPISGLRPILARLVGLQGGMPQGDAQTIVMTPTARYFVDDPSAAPSYRSLASAAGATPWQYTLRRSYAQELWQRAAAQTTPATA